MNKLKYVPTLPAAMAFLALLLGVMLLFGGRTVAPLRLDSLERIAPGFYSHISNFAISYLLCSSIGYFWLQLGISFRWIAGLCAFCLLCNFGYERWLSVLNTPDMTDAWYGLAGTLTAFLFLALVKRSGLRPNPLAAQAAQE
jgi:hypothetical protein